MRWALHMAGCILLLAAGLGAACGLSATADAALLAGYAHGRAADAAQVLPALQAQGSGPPFLAAVDALDHVWHAAVFGGADAAWDLADKVDDDGSSCWP
ncbi:MAG: hypothetical protein LC624_03950 [Halobacteriales archaeon]|nr:hypothetical protein [Halobacteriales archaeon]